MGSQATPQYVRTVIRKDGKPLLELCGLPGRYMAFSLISGRSDGLLVAQGQTMYQTLRAFLKWRDSGKLE